ncbi:MAG TPA: GDYXXLXY domain-containing protein [Chthoniobacterales bacterium]|jgi:uncharacterized membrane-anchored protein|nr:GDYXXLXY domain-containing protein [Chthoniobacterales bacterium]
MKTSRIVIFILVAAAQLAVPASVVWKRGRTLAYGRVWKFKTEPVDPIDAIRGRYVALRMAAEKAKATPEPLIKGDPAASVFVILKEDPEGFAQVDQISTDRMSGDNVIEVENGYWSDGWQRVRFPFDKLWVAEKIAPQAEQAYRDNSRRGKENAFVTVRVRNGDAALEQLYIDNQPLPEYLRAQSQKK